MNETLNAILARLISIEKKVDCIADPLAHISVEEKGDLLASAFASGDKKRIKAAKKALNGRSLQ